MSGRVLKLKPSESPVATQLPSARLAKLVGLAGHEGVWVELAPSAAPVLARVCIDWDAARLAQAVAQGRSAVLAFEEGDASRPLLLGIVGNVGHVGIVDEPPQPQSTAPAFEVEADADGRRVRLVAREEIALQCGESSITLKRNGRVVIRGSYIETYASGTNRIKGGAVRIN